MMRYGYLLALLIIICPSAYANSTEGLFDGDLSPKFNGIALDGTLGLTDYITPILSMVAFPDSLLFALRPNPAG